jgi:hypothetical protein
VRPYQPAVMKTRRGPQIRARAANPFQRLGRR